MIIVKRELFIDEFSNYIRDIVAYPKGIGSVYSCAIYFNDDPNFNFSFHDFNNSWANLSRDAQDKVRLCINVLMDTFFEFEEG